MGAKRTVQQPMCRVVLVRHAAVAEAGSFLGQRDVALSPVGRRQLRSLGAKLSKYGIQAIYSSDLQRARSTAVAAARTLGLDVEIRKGLREMHFGVGKDCPGGKLSGDSLGWLADGSNGFRTRSLLVRSGSNSSRGE